MTESYRIPPDKKRVPDTVLHRSSTVPHADKKRVPDTVPHEIAELRSLGPSPPLWIPGISRLRFVLGKVHDAKPVEFLGGHLGTVDDAGVDENVQRLG